MKQGFKFTFGAMLAVFVALVLPIAAGQMNAQETQEARCIEENWPWSEEPPASIDALKAGAATIEEVCLPEPETEVMYAQGSANVRQEPQLDAPITRKLQWAEQVDAACGVEGAEWSGSTEWCQIDDGYVHSALLGKDKPVAQPVARSVAAAQPDAPATGLQSCYGTDFGRLGCIPVCVRSESVNGMCTDQQREFLYSWSGALRDPFGGGGKWIANGWVGDTWYEYWEKP